MAGYCGRDVLAAFDQPAGQLNRQQRLVVLAICCMSLLIVGLDATIVNVALPSIQRSLHASVAGLQWTLDAYTLVLASLLMLGGSTADRIGRRRVFQIGLTVFVLASLLCALSTSLPMLVAARALQGVGGAMLNPVAMSIIRNVFEDPRERAEAIGVWGGVFGLSMALGPVLGGALVDGVGWPAVFYVNVPVGLAAIILTARYVPESRAPKPRRLDPAGQLLVIVALATLTYAIIEGPRHGWTSAEILGLFAASAAAFVGLVLYELRQEEPLIEVRFFSSIPFAGASAIAVLAFAGFNGFLFLNTLYLQNVRGLSPLDAGLYMLPTAAMLLVFSPLSGRLVGRRGSRRPTVLGALGMLAGAAMLLSLTTHTPTAYLLTSYIAFGFGVGLINPPITNTAVSGMPGEQAGVAAAVASTSRVVGVTLGVAVIGAITGGGLGSRIGPGFAAATHPGWAIVVGLAAVIFGLGFLTTGRWATDTARRTAERFRAPPQPALATSGGGN
jgi:EmrB/QacA subfamily drug resistance transporter